MSKSDKGINLPYEDIQHVMDGDKRTSAAQKQKSMLTHLDYFLRNCYQEGCVLRGENLTMEEISDELVGKFCTYLSKMARKKCDPFPSPLLAWSTIQGYFSSFKMFFIDKFHKIPASLSNELTKRYVGIMLRTKTEIVTKEGVPLYGKKECASEEDFKGFTAVCFWNDDLKSAEYLHLVWSAVHNCGRGSEIAMLNWAKVGTVTIHQCDGAQFDTMQMAVNRLKTAAVNPGEDLITHLVHAEDFMKCYMFMMFYHLVMAKSTEEQGEHMFPSWFKSVMNSKTGDIESSVSSQFKEHWAKIMVIGKNYVTDQEANELMSEFCIDEMANASKPAGAHDPKIHGVGKLGDSNLAPQHIIPRAGWLMKMFHTFFDYWNGTFKSMQKSAEVMGGWPVGQDEGMKGMCGNPPDFSCLQHDMLRVDKFVEYLLGNCVGLTKTMKRMLVANGLRFFDNCTEFLRKEPSGKFRGEHLSGNCLFLNTIHEGLKVAQVSKNEFEEWRFNIRRDFWLKNCWTVPKFREKLGGVPLNQFPASFTLADYFRHCDQRSQALHINNQSLRQEIREYSNKVDTLTAQNATMMDLMKDIHHKVCPEYRIEITGVCEESIPTPETNRILEYSKISEMMANESLDNALFLFIKYSMQEAYKNLGDAKTDRRSHFSKWAKCAKLVTTLLDPLNTGTPQQLKLEINRVLCLLTQKCVDVDILKEGNKLSKTILSSGGLVGQQIQTIVDDLKPGMISFEIV